MERERLLGAHGVGRHKCVVRPELGDDGEAQIGHGHLKGSPADRPAGLRLGKEGREGVCVGGPDFELLGRRRGLLVPLPLSFSGGRLLNSISRGGDLQDGRVCGSGLFILLALLYALHQRLRDLGGNRYKLILALVIGFSLGLELLILFLEVSEAVIDKVPVHEPQFGPHLAADGLIERF